MELLILGLKQLKLQIILAPKLLVITNIFSLQIKIPKILLRNSYLKLIFHLTL